MATFLCDDCGKSYAYMRNLKRHHLEKHCEVEYWNCVVIGCKAKFIRRSYLYNHLCNIHGLSKCDSRSEALNATRGDKPNDDMDYVQDVSADESIFELIEQNETENNDKEAESMDKVDSDDSVGSADNGVVNADEDNDDDIGEESDQYSGVSDNSVEAEDVDKECMDSDSVGDSSGSDVSDSNYGASDVDVGLQRDYNDSNNVGSVDDKVVQCGDNDAMEQGDRSGETVGDSKYSDISDDDDNNDDVVIMDDMTVSRKDKSVRIVVDQIVMSIETEHYYRGDEIIGSKKYICSYRDCFEK